MKKNVRTRFAPSPTGAMHIGNLRTALYAYLFARKNKGSFILRIEDTDQARFDASAIEVIKQSLQLAGLAYDEGPDKDGAFGPYVQSERRDLYQRYIAELIEKDGAYYCFCTAERLAKMREATVGGVTKYDGHCRSLTSEQIASELSSQKPHIVRQKVPSGETVSFTDTVFGTITVQTDDIDDGVLMKSDGLPTYNFANVIDDHTMEISHVIRGMEFLSSTPRYILLYKKFGWNIPEHIHLPPIMKSQKQKLSKREGDASFLDLIHRGYLPEAAMNYIALLGWNPGTDQEIFSLDQLASAFDLDGLQKSPAIFDIKKLNWFNEQYLRAMSEEEFNQLCQQYYTPEIQKTVLDLKELSKLLQTRIVTSKDIPEQIDFFAELPEYVPDMFENKKMKVDRVGAAKVLGYIITELENVTDWSLASMTNFFTTILDKGDYTKGQLLWPVRVALSGKQTSPGGAIELAYLLGKEETLRRLDVGAKKLAVS